MGKDETTAVFCVSEQEADEADEAEPATYTAVRRQDARRSCLGLQAELGSIFPERIKDLAEGVAAAGTETARGRARPNPLAVAINSATVVLTPSELPSVTTSPVSPSHPQSTQNEGENEHANAGEQQVQQALHDDAENTQHNRRYDQQ